MYITSGHAVSTFCTFAMHFEQILSLLDVY